MEKRYNKNNYFAGTYGVFKQLKSEPSRRPDFISSTGSKYWYEGDYLIRSSNHWSGYFYGHSKIDVGCCRIASCKWYIRASKNLPLDPCYNVVGRVKFSELKKATVRK